MAIKEGQINLMQIPGSMVARVGGRNAIVVMLDECPNVYYLPSKSEGRKDAVYMDLSVWDRKEPDQRGNTNFIKLEVSRFNKERFKLDDDTKKDYCPIIGNLRPSGQSKSAAATSVKPAEPQDITIEPIVSGHEGISSVSAESNQATGAELGFIDDMPAEFADYIDK